MASVDSIDCFGSCNFFGLDFFWVPEFALACGAEEVAGVAERAAWPSLGVEVASGTFGVSTGSGIRIEEAPCRLEEEEAVGAGG